MKKKIPYDEIVEYFGGVTNMANEISKTPWPITRNGIYFWDGIIPPGRTYQIEFITESHFRASDILEKQQHLLEGAA